MNKNTSFYSEKEIKQLNFCTVGKNVLISRKASFYGVNRIKIGDNVRIDDFCILSGEICLGSYVHISAYSALYGKYGIYIENFCGVSPRTTIFSAIDDFSGQFMIGPLVPEYLTNVQGGMVILKKYSQVGAGSIIFPKVTLKEGSILGALSLAKEDLEEWTINAGIPSKFIKKRMKNIITLEKDIIKNDSSI